MTPQTPETLSTIDVSEFRKVVQARRSVRKFENTPIPESIINECLDWAILAPNSSNLQPWEFLWVRTPELKQKLVEACFSQPAAATAPELVVFVAHTHKWDDVRKSLLQHYENLKPEPPKSALHYYKKLVPYVYGNGPYGFFGYIKKFLSLIAGIKRPVPREPFTKSELTTWAVKTCALACENFMLGMSAHGFDSCPMEGFDSRRVRKLLNLDSNSTPVMIISCGKRAPGGVYGPRLRLPREQVVREI
jgi:nitroreductase